uniref:NADH dehydrogenase subunit 6 n=1 Tax=Stictopleurus subviridis TaxID=319428 RepID=C6F041_9HEMI|nr:NADH dehydrogenase subunit 6 [Stictopleurus subviridis]ACF04102.1 NADH dehydrogenase subunit 6 [Stictopleurus subviridis]URN72955.1 NADH dehydrogenase subunit 6 [Liorhyssus hyalinus]
MTLLLMMLTLVAFIFMWLNHPISMGITIIIQTLIIAMISGMILGSFWFSYIIVITMLSGMLVLFIYMASVASNEKFFSSIKLIFITLSVIMLSLLAEYMLMNSDIEMMKMNIITPELISLNTLFNMKFKFITMMMVMFLFLTMITVSLIVNISEGPLRINKK